MFLYALISGLDPGSRALGPGPWVPGPWRHVINSKIRKFYTTSAARNSKIRNAGNDQHILELFRDYSDYSGIISAYLLF